jgi:gluconolactonase
MRRKILRNLIACAALAAVPVMTSSIAAAQAPAATPAAPPPPAPLMPPSLVPAHTVNLMTAEGSAVFGAVWRTAEARVVEVAPMAGRMPGYDKTFDMQPHAGEANFDDSKWQIIEAKGLADRRGGGKSSFLWYRTTLTIPAKIGDFDTAGAKAVFTAYVDDYAEVWINGQMPRRSGYPSPATIQGLNMPNRVVLAETVNAGDKFQIAVFGINGPISVAPSNFIFFRDAKMEFYK